MLFHWIPMVQDQGVLGMPIKKDVEFAPIDITDLGRALISVTFPSKHHPGGGDYHHEIQMGLAKLDIAGHAHTHTHACGEHEPTPVVIPVTPMTAVAPTAGPGDGIDRHDGQTYTLTGPETVTGPKLADELTRALQSDKKHKDKVITTLAYLY
jgi:hypothetical protein